MIWKLTLSEARSTENNAADLVFIPLICVMADVNALVLANGKTLTKNLESSCSWKCAFKRSTASLLSLVFRALSASMKSFLTFANLSFISCLARTGKIVSSNSFPRTFIWDSNLSESILSFSNNSSFLENNAADF